MSCWSAKCLFNDLLKYLPKYCSCSANIWGRSNTSRSVSGKFRRPLSSKGVGVVKTVEVRSLRNNFLFAASLTSSIFLFLFLLQMKCASPKINLMRGKKKVICTKSTIAEERCILCKRSCLNNLGFVTSLLG